MLINYSSWLSREPLFKVRYLGQWRAGREKEAFSQTTQGVGYTVLCVGQVARCIGKQEYKCRGNWTVLLLKFLSLSEWFASDICCF